MAVWILNDLSDLERSNEFRPKLCSSTKFELDVSGGQQNPLTCNIMRWASVFVSIVLLPIFGSLYTFLGSLESLSVLLEPLLSHRNMCRDSNRCRSVRMESIHNSECTLNSRGD